MDSLVSYPHGALAAIQNPNLMCTCHNLPRSAAACQAICQVEPITNQKDLLASSREKKGEGGKCCVICM